MFAKSYLRAAFCALGVLALASQNAFASIPWGSSLGAGPSGNDGTIIWANGQTDNGYFGDPSVSGASIIFPAPSNFIATGSNGSAGTKSDRLSFTLKAANGGDIQAINIRELGDWSILGGGQVKVAGALYVTKLNSPGFSTVWSDTLKTVYSDDENASTYNSPAHPNLDGSGTWDGSFTIDLPAGTTEVQVVLNNILQATSLAGGTSTIQKKYVGDPEDGSPMFKIEAVVPEPASVSLLIVGAAGVLLRRRRNAIAA